MDGEPRPLAFGYLQVGTRTISDVEGAREAIADRARAEGYTLDEVFVDQSAGGYAALGEMLLTCRAARRRLDDPRAVILPTADDLGTDRFSRLKTRERIEENDLILVFLG